jgi:hypothetical protein
MSPSSSQQWRRIRYSDAHLRVSDADRNAVAERLAAHYGDGRLDQAEFDDRVGRAMSAKTRGDLDGLFDDLPDPEPAGASGTGGTLGPAVPYRVSRRRGAARPLLLVVLVIALMVAIGHTFAALYLPWFWVAVVLLAIVFTSRSARSRHDR